VLRLSDAPTRIAAVSGSTEVQPELIADPGRAARVCADAAASGVVAVDTESDSLHSYFHKVCLIQITFAGRNAVLDPLALTREGLQPFVEVLADPGVEKLLHGADYDLRVLDRDLGARIVHLRDTQVAAQLLGEQQTGLAALVEREMGIALDKRYQRADWGRRPIEPELLAYAAGDTAHLALLRERLGGRLDALGRLAWWEEECLALEEVRWEAPDPDPRAFERIKGARRLASEARDRLAALHAWREREAAAEDIPPFKVVQGDALLALATSPPADLAALAAVRGIGRSTVRRFGSEILRAISHPAPAPPRETRARPEVDREREALVRQARSVRDALAKELLLDPGVLAPRAGLELVVERRPRTEGELAYCLGRRWRASVMAAAMLPVVEGWEGGASVDAEPP
jgi:ribonuclease D